MHLHRVSPRYKLDTTVAYNNVQLKLVFSITYWPGAFIRSMNFSFKM
jgi:hypothetical protein